MKIIDFALQDDPYLCSHFISLFGLKYLFAAFMKKKFKKRKKYKFSDKEEEGSSPLFPLLPFPFPYFLSSFPPFPSSLPLLILPKFFPSFPSIPGLLFTQVLCKFPFAAGPWHSFTLINILLFLSPYPVSLPFPSLHSHPPYSRFHSFSFEPIVALGYI